MIKIDIVITNRKLILRIKDHHKQRFREGIRENTLINIHNTMIHVIDERSHQCKKFFEQKLQLENNIFSIENIYRYSWKAESVYSKN